MNSMLWSRGCRYFIAAAVVALTSVLLWGCDSGDDEDQVLSTKATCGADDNPETGLQGQTTLAERMGTSAKMGINCNLKLLGQFRGEGAYHAQTWIDDCSFYSTANGAGQAHPGVAVIDVSDPTKPNAVAYLNAPGMLQTWESLKVSTQRKLVAGVLQNTSDFALYDVSDCKHPALKAAVQLQAPDGSPIRGHAGAMAPDGRTYYQSTFPVSIAIVDIADTTSPKVMLNWIPPDGVGQPHDLSISRDNTRAYVMQVSSGSVGKNGVVTLDVSDFHARRANPQVRVVSTLYWPEASGAMTTEEITIRGKPYLLVSDEGQTGSRANACAGGNSALFGFGRIIDISDITRPAVVTKLMLDVDDPKNCDKLQNDPGFTTTSFGYSAHYCTADNREDARLVACSRHEAGVRVYDISDLNNPREIAYWKPAIHTGENIPGSGINGTANRLYDWNKSHSRFLNRNGRFELWTTSNDNGFQALQFSDSVVNANRSSFNLVPTSLTTITVP